jgi:hypothetical protein
MTEKVSGGIMIVENHSSTYLYPPGRQVRKKPGLFSFLGENLTPLVPLSVHGEGESGRGWILDVFPISSK